MPVPDETVRAVRRHVGVYDGRWAFLDWVELYRPEGGTDAEAKTEAEADLASMLLQYGDDARLVAAEILTTLADPAMERNTDHGGERGSLDTKGRMKAFLAKATALRAQVAAEQEAAAGALTSANPSPILEPWGIEGG